MDPRPHHGFEPDPTVPLDCVNGATLVDDPRHPSQRQMRAIVEAEQARIAAETFAGGETKMGYLVLPESTERSAPASDGAAPVARASAGNGSASAETPSGGPELPPRALVQLASLDPSEHRTVHDFEEVPMPDVGPAAQPRDPSLPWQGEWLEVEERRGSSALMVRAVSDESLDRAPCASGVPNVIRSTNPPPGPERSVVVHQVSPFGSDARVVSKPKRMPIPPQHETVPFGHSAVVAGRARTPPRAQDCSAEVDGPGAVRVLRSEDVRPQRFIPTRIRPNPAKKTAAPRVRRELLPLTSALCAVVVAVAALVNVLMI